MIMDTSNLCLVWTVLCTWILLEVKTCTGQCHVRMGNLPVKSDLEFTKLQGVWYETLWGSLDNKKGNRPWRDHQVSLTLRDTETMDAVAQFRMMNSENDVTSGQCSYMRGYMREQTKGRVHYSVHNEALGVSENQLRYILDTDYETYMFWFACKYGEEGICFDVHVNASLYTREAEVPVAVYQKYYSQMEQLLCVGHGWKSQIVHEKECMADGASSVQLNRSSTFLLFFAVSYLLQTVHWNYLTA